MVNQKKLALAVRLASMGLVGSFYTGTSAFAQDEEAGPTSIEEVLITGSRIKRDTTFTSAPIQTLSADYLQDIGRYSVADALRTSTSNSFGSIIQTSGSTAQSQATVDLLGVGSDRTLVLLDDIRAPGSPSLGGTAVNINQIPMAMVESIEIYKGGASSVYGSDAVAGVVNIRLKKDYEGLTISANASEPDDPGGESNDFSMVLGISSDKGNITFAYEHAEQKPVFDVDRPYTAPSWEDTDNDGAYDVTIGVSTYGASIQNPDTSLWEPSPLCDELVANVPGFVGVIEQGAADNNRYCGFAFAGVSANQASTNRDSVFVNATYDIAEGHEFYARAILASNESFGRYAPPAAPWLGGVPVSSDHNPYDEPVNGQFRWHEIGNRDGLVSDYSQDYVAGLNGTFFDGIDYDVYYHHNTTDNKQVGEFYLSFSGLFYNIYAGNDLGSEFGIDNMRATTLTQDHTRFDQFFGGISFDAGSLPGGDISHYVGAESFNIEYQSKVDAQSEAGLIGGSAGSTAGRGRDIWAVFYESVFPITDTIEAEFAIRHDDYTDFGTKTSPKFAVTYRPTDEWMVRASWAKGFRAPTLEELSQADGFAADFANDWVRCYAEIPPEDTFPSEEAYREAVQAAMAACPEDQYDTTRQANPNLQAETSTYINLGTVYQNSALSVSVDYFNLEIEDAIRFVPIQDLILAEFIGVPLPDPLTTIDRSTNGPANPIFRTATINGPGLEVSGLEIGLDYLWELTAAGSLNFEFDTTYFVEWKEDNYAGGPLQDKAGWSLQPEYRAQFTTTWSLGPHSVAWNMDYIPSTSGYETPDISSIEALRSGLLLTNETNDSFLIHNISYSFDAGSWGEYRLGVRNATDEDPVLNAQGEYANQYDYLYSAGHIGRLWTVGATWEF